MALEISEDAQFHRREWMAQRIGWIVILLIVCTGVAGLAGRGPFGERHLESDMFSITYDWIMRYHAPGTVELSVDAPHAGDTVVRVWATQTLIQACNPQQYIPDPAQTTLSGDTVIFIFPRTSIVSRGRIRIACEPHSFGRYRPSVGVVGGPTFTLSIVVLP